MRLKFVFISFACTVGTFILSARLQSISKFTSPYRWLQNQLENSSVNAGNHSHLLYIRGQRSSGDSQSMSILKSSFSPLQVEVVPHSYPKAPVYFRNLFNDTYNSQVNIGPDQRSTNTRYLIYRCDRISMRVCGGWADRIKGAIAAYIIANLTGRVFKMEMLTPTCDIQQFLLPNFVNWSLPVSFHKVVKTNPEVAILNFIDNVNFWNRVKTIDFLTLPAMNAKYVYYKSNFDYMDSFKQSALYQNQLSWMHNLTRDQINSAMFKRLFKPSPLLLAKVEDFLSRNLGPDNKLVCVHVRTGRNPSLPKDTAERLREKELPSIWDFVGNVSIDERDRIFLMSDSKNVLDSAKRQSFHSKLFYSSGNIVHVERSPHLSNNEMCSGLGRVITDQFVLMRCDVLIISKSGLSRMAAYVRGSNQGLYCIMKGGQIEPCEMSQFTEIYGIMG